MNYENGIAAVSPSDLLHATLELNLNAHWVGPTIARGNHFACTRVVTLVPSLLLMKQNHDVT